MGDWRLSTDVPLLAWELGAAVRVGSSFALVERGLADLEPVARVARALGLEAPEQGPRVVPLWHDGSVALPGAVFEGRTLPHGQLCGLWLDKAVYTPRSSVHILVACPGAKDTEVPVWIWREGQKHREMKIALGSRGLGHMELRGLPTGVWTVQLIWPQPTSSGAARFVVSDAAPPEFVARWFERRFVTDPKGNLQLAFAVGLRLHGRPVPGSVRLALRHMKSGALRWLTQVLRADPFGVVRAQIDAPGEEAWALCFVADALGSQMTQLELPPPPIGLEPVGLGPMTFGASVVVSGSARASMGLDFLPGRALDTLPLTVSPCPKGDVLDLHVHESIKALKVLRFEPLSCRVECADLGDVEAEQRLEVPIEDPVGLISAAGFVGMHEEPWESWGGWFAQDESPGIELSWVSGVESNQGLPRVVSGAAPELSIKLHLDEPALVLLLARRERSPLGSEVIGEILAPLGAVLWKTLGELGRTLDGKQRLESLFDAAGGRAALAQVLDRIRNPEAESKAPALEAGDSSPQRPQPWFDVDSVEGSQAEVLMLSALEVHGEGSVSLPAVSGDGVLRVEALVAHGTRWQRAGLRARLGAFAQASLRLPPFVDGTDHVQGHLLVKTWSGTSRLHLEVDGKPQAARLHPRTSDGEETLIVSGEPLPPYASLTFPVVPGRWVVRVEGSELEPPLIFHTVVSPAGRLKARRRAYKPVFEGGPVADAGVLGAESGLQVLATPERALEEMIRAVLDAPWRTCESLAAMLVAATVAHRRGWRSEAALLLTLQEVGDELAALFVPGKGFALNQKSGQISRPISDLAVRHLLRLEALAVGLNQAAKERLARVGRLARRAALASDVVIPPPPDSLRNADDADLLLRFRADRFAVAAATVRARLKRRASRRDQEASKGRSSVRGEVARRCDLAYSARVLLQSDDPLDHRAAWEALGMAMSTPRRMHLGRGGATNTVDTTALIFALDALMDGEPSQPTRLKLGDRAVSIAELEREPLDRVEVSQGLAWVQWSTWIEDDLTDPAEAITFHVSLRRPRSKSPEVNFTIGEDLELVVDLGEPASGGGYHYGDWIEIHLPEALEPAGAEPRMLRPAGGHGVSGRRLWLDLSGRHRVRVPLRAVGLTLGADQNPGAQHLAAGLRNIYDSGRGRGMMGLSVVVAGADKGLGSKLKRLFF